MKATIRISDLQMGHVRGLISRTRFMQAAQEDEALGVGSRGKSSFADSGCGRCFLRSPRELWQAI